MAGVCVIVAYRPKAGKQHELLKLVRDGVPTLRKEKLVTDRQPMIMRAKDPTITEVSEWKSREAIDAAHKNPNVLAIWEKFSPPAIACRSRTWPRPKRCSPVSNRSRHMNPSHK